MILIGSLCPPDGVDMYQYTDIVEKYLNKNPESRNENAVILTALAVGKTFPCKNNQ
ncbi:Rap1a/Tai family immunity protein [Escherichia coli]